MGQASHQTQCPQPMARLIVEQGPNTRAVIELQDEPWTPWAAEKCDLCLAGNEAEAEAEHARIWPRQDQFIIRQLGGRPCIRVDGKAEPGRCSKTATG